MEAFVHGKAKSKLVLLAFLYLKARVSTVEAFCDVYDTKPEEIENFLRPEGALPPEWLTKLFGFFGDEREHFTALVDYLEKMHQESTAPEEIKEIIQKVFLLAKDDRGTFSNERLQKLLEIYLPNVTIQVHDKSIIIYNINGAERFHFDVI